MVEAILIMLGCGAVCGSVLSVASKVFYVYEDPRIAEIESNLAGANCGGCGFAGCSAAAAAVVEGKAPVNVCIVSGPEGVAKVAGVMGMEAGAAEALVSRNTCNGGNRATDKFRYVGVQSCSALSKFYGGRRDCKVGCLGMGDCVITSYSIHYTKLYEGIPAQYLVAVLNALHNHDHGLGDAGYT